jgi:methylmalonyl-CoA/ethylmalonyl-CoA epimerase
MDCHHVGIATSDAEGFVDFARDVLETPVAHEEAFDDLSVTFLDCGGASLEVLEPESGAEGPIPRFLERRGTALHHVGFATPDAAAAIDRARAAGIEPIDPEPRPGAWGHDVAFLHPEDTWGVLVEFVETGG